MDLLATQSLNFLGSPPRLISPAAASSSPKRSRSRSRRSWRRRSNLEKPLLLDVNQQLQLQLDTKNLTSQQSPTTRKSSFTQAVVNGTSRSNISPSKTPSTLLRAVFF